MLGNKPGKFLLEYRADYVLFDLETTGLSSEKDAVIEISAVKVRAGQIADEFSCLVNPQRPIPYAASSVNHITNAMVKNAKIFCDVLKEFNDFIGEDVLVGHNIHNFDMKFIQRDCREYFGQYITNDCIDTLKLARLCFPAWKSRTLSVLSNYYGISTDGAHRALADCRMNQRVFENLKNELGKLGEIPAEQVRICPMCNSEMVRRNGRYGEFWGCSNFPNCRHTEKI